MSTNNYGFAINLTGDAVHKLKDVQGSIKNTASTAEHAANEIKNKFSGAFKMIGGFAMGAFGVMGAWDFVKKSLEAYDKYEESLTKVKTALTSTKAVAGETTNSLIDDASKISKNTLYGKSAILDAQSMLLTFTGIQKGVFESAMRSVTDFATRYKMELPEAALMVGKALNNPLKGMTKLQRMGVVFNETQKATITKFMEQNKVAEAQKIILTELQTEFGGLAHAMTQTDAGKIAMANKQWGQIKIAVGQMASELLVKLIPALDTLIDKLKQAGKLWNWLYGNKEESTVSENVDSNLEALQKAGNNWKKVYDIKIKQARDGYAENDKVIKDIESRNKYLNPKLWSDEDLENYKKARMWRKAYGKSIDAMKAYAFGKNFIDTRGGAKGGAKGGANDPNRKLAYNTSNLSGANGGLGQAKVINIRIDTVQKNDIKGVDVDTAKDLSKQAVEVIVRELNNISQSQSGTM